MGEGPSYDSTILVEFVAPDGTAVTLNDLGVEFLEAHGIPMAQWERPFRIEVEARRSKAGNVFFEYQQASVPLPHGLDTRLRVEGRELDPSEVRPSQSGHPTRRLMGVTNVSGLPYTITAYVTQGKKPYWIKVHAQKGARTPQSDVGAPQGGRIA
jgi:hypothetical protein